MKALLLNSSYEPISFIPLKRLIKLIVNDKVEIIESWPERISWGSGGMDLPAVIRLKYYIKRPLMKRKFNRKAIFIRDQYTCLYCGIAVTAAKITVDHIIPVSKGGILSWLNAVSSCNTCNSKKSNKTLEEAGMKLLKQPFIPETTLNNEYILIKPKHICWKDYFSNVEWLIE